MPLKIQILFASMIMNHKSLGFILENKESNGICFINLTTENSEMRFFRIRFVFFIANEKWLSGYIKVKNHDFSVDDLAEKNGSRYQFSILLFFDVSTRSNSFAW